MHTTGHLEPDDFWAVVERGEARIRAAAGELPLFGVTGWTGPLRLGDWEWEDARLTRAGLAFGEPRGLGPHVHVQVSRNDPVEVVHNLRLGRITPGPDDAVSYLSQRRRIAAEPAIAVRMPVDGTLTDFALWDDGVYWYAAARLDGYGLIVEARSIAPDGLELLRVDDVEPYLAGRRTDLRARRWEG